MTKTFVVIAVEGYHMDKTEEVVYAGDSADKVEEIRADEQYKRLTLQVWKKGVKISESETDEFGKFEEYYNRVEELQKSIQYKLSEIEKQEIELEELNS